MSGRDLFANNKRLIITFVKIIKIAPLSCRFKFLGFFRGTKGKIGVGIRYLFLKSVAKECGDNVSIHENVVLLGVNNLKIGDNMSIHSNCYIDAGGGISIGNNVSVATASVMISSTHTWEDSKTPIKYNPMRSTPIIIDNDVWLGCNVKIIGPCHLGERTICAAGAVVKGNVEGHCIMGGVPAKVIKTI
jgi:acetyltransferase-like isoleucine patch superfamily enzyme